MPQLTEFLSKNPELETDAQPSLSDNLSIPAVVTSVTSVHVYFEYQGSRYSVDRNNVVDISENASAPAPEKGKAVLLQMKPDAVVSSQVNLPAGALVAQKPFALRHAAPPLTVQQTPADKAWRERVGYPFSLSNPLSGVSISFTGWKFDDAGGDAPVAGMSHPFSNPALLSITSEANTDSTCPWDDGHGGRAQIYDDNKADKVD